MDLSQALNQTSEHDDNELFLEMVKDCSTNFHRNINTAYRRGMAKPCVDPIWQEIAEELSQTASQRTINRVAVEKQDTTQEQWSDELQIAQSTVCKWFQSGTGSTDFGNLVLGMTCFGIDSLELADLDQRIIHGYIEAIKTTRERELGLPKQEASEGVIYAVSELYRPEHAWLKARALEGKRGYRAALEDSSQAIGNAANKIAGRNLGYSTPEDFIDLQETWGISWLIVVKCSPLITIRESGKGDDDE